MTLKEHIIAALKKEPIGLQLKELAERIPPAAYGHNNDKISNALNKLASSLHVSKNNAFPARWSITPQGRAYYSDLNQDVVNETSKNNPEHDPLVISNDADVEPITQDRTLPADEDKTEQSPLDADIERQSAALSFDLSNTLDRALYGLLKVIKDCAEPIIIADKFDALDLLNDCENNNLFNGPTRATFARIRHAVEQMEDDA